MGGDSMVLTKKHIFAVIIMFVVVAACLAIKAGRESRQTFGNNRLTVVVDAGHGAPDGGAVGANGTIEKDINFAIAEKLCEILENEGVQVVMTRSSDSGIQDESADTIRKMKVSDMNNRLNIIKKSGADLFLSIHMNSFENSKVHGLHIFYDKEHSDIEALAKSIQESISNVTGAEAHTVKTADETLFLMKNSPIPAILAECGFLSNPEEEKKLCNEEYQSKIAWAIAEEIIKYYNIS
jgi:N-acetylmuramoyl-L-alanine amidase